MTEDESFDLVPTHLAVQAMRDNGYRNTAYAVAELIDNAIQAGATDVELICVEEEELVQERIRGRLRNILVADNGSGMDSEVLRMALQFGNGTHLKDRSGIGRFGMGLPSASISQCKRVEVWSWQNGPESALFSYVDLGEVEAGRMRNVPLPERRPIPDKWLDLVSNVGVSGTLVVWSTLDRVMWRTARSVVRNSEFLIARMYRRFLDGGRVSIRMAAFSDGAPPTQKFEEFARPNDPSYLIAPSSTPAPYDESAMFQPEGEHWEVERVIKFRGREHSVFVRFAYAKEDARAQANAGALPYGKHAAKNVGISLVRADRELDMDEGLVISYDPVERWWGVEIDFPPSLDELFGVTNNKQAARNFSDVSSGAKADAMSLEERDERDDDEDPLLPLYEIVKLVDRRVQQLRGALRVQTKGSRSRRRHDPDSPESRGTQATRERQAEGFRGASDADEERPSEEREAELRRELVESGLTESQAEEMAATTVSSGIKYAFAETKLEGRSFFTVQPVAGEILVKINVNHPAYQNLVEVLEDTEDLKALGEEALRDRLAKANRGLKLLLLAWARYEDEQPTEQQRMKVQDIRTDWGRVAYRFLESD